KIILVEVRVHHRLGPGTPRLNQGGASQLRGLPLPRPRPGVDLVEDDPAPGPVPAERARLGLADLGELVVVRGAKGSLAVTYQGQGTHQCGPTRIRFGVRARAWRWSRGGPRRGRPRGAVCARVPRRRPGRSRR